MPASSSNNADKPEALTAALHQNLPPPPPRPYAGSYNHVTVMLNAPNYPVHKFATEDEIRIGRHSSADVEWCTLDLGPLDGDDRSISRKHAYIFHVERNYFIEDLASTNGTWVNGLRLQPQRRRLLLNKDYIQVGRIGFWVFLPAPPKHTDSDAT